MTKNEDKGFVALGIGMIVVWIAAAMLSLCFTGTVIWAIIQLVSHFTR